MTRILAALVLVGLAINPALHWCCLGAAPDSMASAMPSCHADTGDAPTRVAADTACRHDWTPALTPETSTRADATVSGAVIPASCVPAFTCLVHARAIMPAPDLSPPITPLQSLRI